MHERSLRLGQHGDLLGRQVVAVHRDGPAELEQGLQREAGRRDGSGLGRADHGAQLWMRRQLGGHEDVDADGAQAGAGVTEEVHHVGVAEGQRAGPGLLQQAGQRRPGAAAAAQRQEQIGVGAVAEAGSHGGGGGPDVGGVDGKARVHGAGELHHCDERAVGPVGQLQAQRRPHPGVGGGGEVREPRVESRHVVRLRAGVGAGPEHRCRRCRTKASITASTATRTSTSGDCMVMARRPGCGAPGSA